MEHASDETILAIAAASSARWAEALELLANAERVEREFVPHDHRSFVDGCFRCSLSRDESEV